MGFIIINVFLLVFVIILLLMISAVWPPDSPWAPWWQMPKEVARQICYLTKVNKQSVIYDLGCGTGHALIIAAKEFDAKGIGIEIDPLRYLIARWNVKRFRVRENITLIKGDFFSVPLANATVLFIYLVPNTLKKITPKLLKELKSGTMLASYKYEMPVDLFKKRLEQVKHDKKNHLYIYRMI